MCRLRLLKRRRGFSDTDVGMVAVVIGAEVGAAVAPGVAPAVAQAVAPAVAPVARRSKKTKRFFFSFLY